MSYSSPNSILYGTFKEISNDDSDSQFIDFFNNGPLSLFFREFRNILLHTGINNLQVIPMLNLKIDPSTNTVTSKKIKINIHTSPLISCINTNDRLDPSKKTILTSYLNNKGDSFNIFELVEEYTQKIFNL